MTPLTKETRAEVFGHFQKFQTIYLSTVEGVAPRVRPVTLAHLDGRFWVLTGTTDAKVTQIRSNPNFEYCLPFSDDKGNGYIRASGVIEVIHDPDLRASIAEQCDYFGKYWDDPDDPSFALLELQFKEVEYLRPGDTKATRWKV